MRALSAWAAVVLLAPAAAAAPPPCADEDARLGASSSIDVKAIAPACREAVELRTAPARLLRHLEAPHPLASLTTVDLCAFHPTWSLVAMIRGLEPEAGDVANAWCLVGLAETGLPAALDAVDRWLAERGLVAGQIDAGLYHALDAGIATAALRARLLPVLEVAAATPHVIDRELVIDAVCGADASAVCVRARRLEAVERQAELPVDASACRDLLDRWHRVRSEGIDRITAECRREVDEWRAPTSLLRQLSWGFRTRDATARESWLAFLCAFRPSWGLCAMIAGLDAVSDKTRSRCLVGLSGTGRPEALAAVDAYLAARGFDGGRLDRAVRLSIEDEAATRSYRARLAPLLERASANEVADQERIADERRVAEAHRARDERRRHRAAVVAGVLGSMAYGALAAAAPPGDGVADVTAIGGAVAGATVAIALVHRAPTSGNPMARLLEAYVHLVEDTAVGVAAGGAGGVAMRALGDGSPARRFAAGAVAAGAFSTAIVKSGW